MLALCLSSSFPFFIFSSLSFSLRCNLVGVSPETLLVQSRRMQAHTETCTCRALYGENISQLRLTSKAANEENKTEKENLMSRPTGSEETGEFLTRESKEDHSSSPSSKQRSASVCKGERGESYLHKEMNGETKEEEEDPERRTRRRRSDVGKEDQGLKRDNFCRYSKYTCTCYCGACTTDKLIGLANDLYGTPEEEDFTVCAQNFIWRYREKPGQAPEEETGEGDVNEVKKKKSKKGNRNKEEEDEEEEEEEAAAERVTKMSPAWKHAKHLADMYEALTAITLISSGFDLHCLSMVHDFVSTSSSSLFVFSSSYSPFLSFSSSSPPCCVSSQQKNPFISVLRTSLERPSFFFIFLFSSSSSSLLSFFSSPRHHPSLISSFLLSTFSSFFSSLLLLLLASVLLVSPSFASSLVNKSAGPVYHLPQSNLSSDLLNTERRQDLSSSFSSLSSQSSSPFSSLYPLSIDPFFFLPLSHRHPKEILNRKKEKKKRDFYAKETDLLKKKKGRRRRLHCSCLDPYFNVGSNLSFSSTTDSFSSSFASSLFSPSLLSRPQPLIFSPSPLPFPCVFSSSLSPRHSPCFIHPSSSPVSLFSPFSSCFFSDLSYLSRERCVSPSFQPASLLFFLVPLFSHIHSPASSTCRQTERKGLFFSSSSSTSSNFTRPLSSSFTYLSPSLYHSFFLDRRTLLSSPSRLSLQRRRSLSSSLFFNSPSSSLLQESLQPSFPSRQILHDELLSSSFLFPSSYFFSLLSRSMSGEKGVCFS
ncbi:hypothetical protein CSUI_000010, partial [Cystoisospora suis]